MNDRDFAERNPELAKTAKIVAGLDARLVRIDTKAGIDEYHVLKGFKDTAVTGSATCFYFYSRSGGTGTRGSMDLQGPMEQPKVAQAFAKVFEEKTGKAWGQLKAGDEAERGKFWLQNQGQYDPTAKWQYYVSDGVDGKKTGWYPYDPKASDEVEEIYAQHVANECDERTSTRIVASGYFKYRINLDKMTQTNQRTNKVRTIRRAEGSDLQESLLRKGSSVLSRKGSGTKLSLFRAAPAVPMKAAAMKAKKPAMKKAMKKVMKKVMKKKAMKKKAMKKKAMKKKAMKKVMKKKLMTDKQKRLARKARSKIGTKSEVFSGKKQKTKEGFKKADLMRSKSSKKIVSKRKSASCKDHYNKNIATWVTACKKAREELGLTGFVAIKKGTPLYEKAKELLPSVKPVLLRKASTKTF